MKKLKAFTLIELLVTMAISGIVISASYFCFSIVTQQMNGFKTSTDKVMEVALLKTLIESDMHRFQYLRTISDHEMEFSSKEDIKINYRFGSDFILRDQNEITDTLKVKIGELIMKFEKKAPEQQNGLIDEVIWTVQLPDTSYFMHFSKEYAPDVLMNAEEQEYYPYGH